MRRIVASMMLVVLGLSLTGCATWVNIPAQPGDVARHDPNIPRVVRLQTTALEAVIRDQSPPEPIYITLPLGVNPNSQNLVRASLSRMVNVTIDPQDRAASHLDLQAIRIRGFDGEVDIVRTVRGGVPHLVTVYLKDDVVAGWHTKRLRTWRGSVRAAPGVLSPWEQAELVESERRHEPVRERVNVELEEAEAIEASWNVEREQEVEVEVEVETTQQRPTPTRYEQNVDVVEIYE